LVSILYPLFLLVFNLFALHKSFNLERLFAFVNPIVAIDFNGAILKPRPFDEAHKKWFRLFSLLLGDIELMIGH
jgi:hypothetical protein